MSAFSQPTPTGPTPRFIVPVLGGLAAAFFLGRWVDFQHPFPVDRGVGPVLAHSLFACAVLSVLAGVFAVIPWLRLYAVSRDYPFEPWRWEFPQGGELVDRQLSTVTRSLVGLAPALPFLLLFNFLIFKLSFSANAPLAVPLLFGGTILGVDALILYFSIIPTVRNLLALMRYGRTRLLLSELPLRPGTETQVELIMPRGLENLRQVSAKIRRVREHRVTKREQGKTTTKKVLKTEIQYDQRIDASEQKSADTLPFVLAVPSAEPKDSTDLNASYRCMWELQLTSDVPGLDLDVTFLIPVYWVAPGAQLAAL